MNSSSTNQDSSVFNPTPSWETGQQDVDRVYLTRVGLQLPSGLSFEEWERTGCQLARIVDSSAWALGDWLVYGKKHYQDRYERAIRSAGLRYQTLRNYAWVTRRFDVSRRRAALSFQHHSELASLTNDEQDKWLDRAESAMWTTKQLRMHMRRERETHASASQPNVSRIEVPKSRLATWQTAAERSGLDLNSWILSILDSEAAKESSSGG